MRASDFAAELRRADRVELAPRFAVEAKVGALAATIADSLVLALSPETEIYAWCQTASFGDNWSGEHRWWLVLESDLMELTVKMIGPEGDKTRAAVSQNFTRLSDVAGPTIKLTFGKDVTPNVIPLTRLR